MKRLSVLSFTIGVIVTIIGVLSCIFTYPYNNTSPNSGPANEWELILIISHEGKKLYLIVGITLMLLSILSFFRQKKLR